LTDSFWLLLRHLGVQPKLVSLIKDLYTTAVCCAQISGELSDWLEVNGNIQQGCTIALPLFLLPVDLLLEWIAQCGFLDVRLGKEVFTDLDYAENMVLLVEMLKVLLLLWIFCNRKPTILQTTTDSPASTVSVAGKTLEFVDSFTYLGSKMHCSGNSDTVTEVHKRFAIAHQCMSQLDRQILCSHIALAFQICLYMPVYLVYIRPISLHDAEAWSMVQTLQKCLDAFYQHCLTLLAYTSHFICDWCLNAEVSRQVETHHHGRR